MKTYLECIPCFTQQTLDAVKMVTDDKQLRLRIMRHVLEAASRFPDDAPPPAMGARIHRLIREETGEADPYRDIKREANEFALGLVDELVAQVNDTEREFETALRLAIAGNIMDWGAKPHTDLSPESVRETMEESLRVPLHGGTVEEVYDRLLEADEVLYLADNAGEIVFDRLFIGYIPADNVTVAVKSGPAINDATMEDARQVGLTERVPVIETGCDTPGVLWEECSPDFRDFFTSADLIIAKGQGN